MTDITFYFRHGGQQSVSVSSEEAARIVGLARANLTGSAYAHQSVTFSEPRPEGWGGTAEVTVRLADVKSFRVFTPDEQLVGTPSMVGEADRA